MILKLFEDLRFVIGLFFAVISTILIIVGYVDSASIVAGQNMNLITGWTMFVFAALMLFLVWRDPQNDEE